MRLRAILLATLVACTGVLVLAPGALAAQRAPKAPDVFKNIPVAGTIASGGTFAGTLDVQRFAAENGALVAYGRLTGILTEPGQIRPVTKAVRLPVSTGGAATARATSAVCPILTLDLAPLNLDLLGLVVQLSAVHLRITAQSGPGQLLGNLLCAVAGLLDQNRVTATARTLNRALRILSGPDVFRGIPVTGSTPAGGVFDGTLNIRRFEQRTSGLVAVGLLRGAVTQVGGTLTQVATVVAVPVSGGTAAGARATAATCRILRLVLGPLHLDLLGLVIDLNRVVLRITAVSGPGNLLGNLLCGIVGLLDRPTAATAATAGTRLNALRRLVNKTQNIRIGGENGRFGGFLDIQRFYAKNGKLWALARLSGTLTRNGIPTKVTDRLVRVPVGLERGDRTIAATCQILRLVLGPLHLDLLGLVVDLNRVVLRITAVSGPGNLLGNLLCGLVGILDPGPVAGTASRLNRNLLLLRQVTV